jgi:hypothetical protein
MIFSGKKVNIIKDVGNLIYNCTCNIVESTYRDTDMTVDIVDNSVVTPRNVRDKISYR